jgi:hypothetical protein
MQAWWIWTALACPVLKGLHFSIEVKGQFCGINYSWLAVIPSQRLNYIAPWFFGFYGLCLEIRCNSYVVTFVCGLAFFSWSFHYPFFVFYTWHFNYDVSWGYSFSDHVYLGFEIPVHRCLYRFWKFSAMILLNRFPMPLVRISALLLPHEFFGLVFSSCPSVLVCYFHMY